MINVYRSVLSVIILSGLLLGLPHTGLAQVTRYVSTTGTNADPSSATSWATSTTNLQGAINASSAGDQVWVGSGTYKPTISTGPDSRTISFSMKDGIAIYGGFVGTETQLSQRPSIDPVNGQPASSTLSGDIGVVGDNADNSYHIIFNTIGLTTTAVLDGFVITGGNDNEGSDFLPLGVGGGVYNGGSGSGQVCNPTFHNCSFLSNMANNGGGAMYNSNTSSPQLTNCLFEANTAGNFQGNGGAIYHLGTSSMQLTNCSFLNNKAGNFTGNGGAIYHLGTSSIQLTNCSFQANTAGNFGGAIYHSSTSSMQLTNCSFEANKATVNGNGGAIYHLGTSSMQLTNCSFLNNMAVDNGNGGAIYNRNSGALKLIDCVFQGNTGQQGGALYNEGSSPQLTSCAFQANHSSFSGGAMNNSSGSSPQLINCSFLSNSSAYGGAMFNYAASRPQLTNCSFQANTATISGGAIRVAALSSAQLTNCVIGGNGGSNTFSNSDSGSEVAVSATYSLFDNTDWVDISGPGNLTATTSPFASTTGVDLATGSPAINTGNNAAYTAAGGPLTDLAGNFRFLNGPIDMGAVEYPGPILLSVLTTVSANPVCAGSTTMLSVTASQGRAPYSYTWAAPSGISLSGTSTSAVSASIGAGLSGVQTLTITVTDGTTPTPVVSTSLVSLTVGAVPTAMLTAGTSSTLTCSQPSLTLTATGGSAGATYAFVRVGGGAGLVSQDATAGTAVVNASGAYSVTVTNATAGCFSTTTITISNGTASLSAGSGTLTCAQTSLTLTATGGNHYVFAGPGGGSAGIVSQDATNGTAVVNLAGVYSATVTDAMGCTSSLTVLVTSNTNSPTATLGASATLLCNQLSLTLTATGGNTGETISYTLLGISNTTGVFVFPGGSFPAGLQTFTVTVSNASSCATTATVSVLLVAPPSRLYVRAGAASPGNGLSWADAFPDLQTALAYDVCAQNLSEIWVAQGVYKPTLTTDRTISFQMRNGVAIYGGFVGTETQLSQRPTINLVNGPGGASQPSSTTLSGDIGMVGNSTDNSYHVINNPQGLDASAVLNGFVITGGNANGNGFPNDYGGGIYNEYSSPMLINCLLQGNNAVSFAGAMMNIGSNPVLTNCAFQSNTASQGGGGIVNASSNPVLVNCSLQDNTANSSGGAILNLNTDSSPLLLNCSFQNNTAPQGGAIFNRQSSVTLTNCVLFNNGGNNTFFNENGGLVTATHSLFDNSVTDYNSDPTNLTTTTSPFVSATSVALAPGSPAINAGNPASQTVANGSYSATALPQTDLVGNPRIVAGRVDMGAVEYQSETLVIIQQPVAGSAVCGGSTVVASVSVNGSALGYQWYKNGAVLTGITSATTASLTLTNVQTGDAGSYSVVVSGGGLSLTSTAFSLTVTVLSVSAGASLPMANVGVVVSLTASTGTLAGAITYQWSAPSSASLTSPANSSAVLAQLTTAGVQTFTVVASSGSCSQSALVSVTALAGPDLSAIMSLPDANFSAGGSKGLLVQVQEVNGSLASGNIVITITVPTGYSVNFDNTLTSFSVSGGMSNPVLVDNVKWHQSSSAGGQQVSITINGGQSVGANTTMNLGFTITRTTANAGSVSNITVNVADDSGGQYDVNRLNNVYARLIQGL